MTDPEQRGPTPIFMQPIDGVFPGPGAAVLLTLAVWFTTGLMVNALTSEMPFIAALGIGQVIGLGGVGALAARRVPQPHSSRIGLQGFPARFILPLLCLLPVVIVISEMDNYIRLIAPPSPEFTEMREAVIELTKIDSAYAAAQTTIVAVGISPVVEGFFFFGILLQGLVARLGRARGVLLTAVLYAMVHFPASGAPGDAIVPLMSGLTIGALLGLARLGTGSVLASMALAAAFAAIHLLAAEGAEYVAIAGFNGPGEHTPAVIVLPSLVAVLWGIWSLWRPAMAADVNPPIPEPEDDPDHEGGFFF